jgi:NitT/TauT family transport system substrate-binding protein
MRRQRAFNFFIILACIALAVLLLGAPALDAFLASPAEDEDCVYLLYASAGSMPQLLNTRQIDAFLAWEPVVANAELSGIGKTVAFPSDLPPPGKWENTAINVLVLHEDAIESYPEICALLSGLTTAAINRTNDEPTLAEQITADWVFGKNPILTPTGTLDPLDVEHRSFANMVFTAYATPPESMLIINMAETGYLASYDPSSFEYDEIAEQGERYLNGTDILPSGGGLIPALQIGYIPSSDNYAPLYVMVMNSSYFCGRYGFCLVADDPKATRPVQCTLQVQGGPVAKIDLIPGQSGGGIMTTIGQGALDGAYVGSYPAEVQIFQGNPSYLIQSINTGGSGLVVDPGAPCDDWEGFVRWIKIRSAEGEPVVLATVQSSIQEDMVREACASENITVRYYGTGFKADDS